MVKRNQTVSVKQIAEAVGVSPSTVSMVLNNRGGEFRIADVTSEKIIQTASELGYQHETRTKRKKRGFSKTLVCAFCPVDFNNGPISQLYAGIHRYFGELNQKYETIVFPYELGKLKDKISFISKDFMSGAVMMALNDEDISFIEHTKFDIPVVLFNRTAKGYSSVLTDDYTVGYNAMEHFMKRGHSRLGIVSPNYSSRSLSLRSTGYRDKFRSSGAEEDGSYSYVTTYGDPSDAGGYAAMEKLLQSGELPTALFVSIDNMMSGVIRRIKEHGIAVPKDMEIISYGSMPFTNIVSPTITSFVPSSEEMSYNCAKLLHRYIEDGVWNDNVKISFEATCVYRESCPE